LDKSLGWPPFPEARIMTGDRQIKVLIVDTVIYLGLRKRDFSRSIAIAQTSDGYL
jgi:hypothetical protein